MTRPTKAERTRRRILDSAATLFAARSFDAVSIRAIAREAHVDPALIHHYFGTKNDLFEAILSHASEPGQVFDAVETAPREQWGEELLRRGLTVLEYPAGPAVRAMLRSGISSHPDLLRRFVSRQLLNRIQPMLPGDEQERMKRATLAGSQLVGLFVARFIVKVEPLASLPRDEVVAAVAPTIQRYLTGPL